MSRIVLGVDGGNTKGHYALFDEDGRALGFHHGGPVCHDTLPGGFSEMKQELGAALRRLLGPLGLKPSDIDRSALGLAGADTEGQHRIIAAMLGDLGLSGFRLVNDAFLGIKAGTAEGWGICCVNGTGTVTAAVAPDGSSVQVGGLGYFSGDEGGGGFLAERVMRAIYDERYRCGQATALTGALLRTLGGGDARELFHAYMEGAIPVLTLAKAAFQVAREGDRVAGDILAGIGRNAGESALGAARQLAFPEGRPIEIVMIGSLFVKADSAILVESFKRKVREGLGDRARFLILDVAPVAGAVLWALEDLRGELGPSLRARVIRESSVL